MSTSEERARAVALKIWLWCKAGSEYDQELAGKEIAAALQAERAAVWDMAVKAVQNLEGRYLGNWNGAVVNAIDAIRSAQAKEVA